VARSYTISGRIVAEDRATANVRKVQTVFGQFNDFLRTRFMVTLGDAQRVARAAFRVITDALDLSRQQRALEIQLARAGESFDAFLGRVTRAAGGTVSQADAIRLSVEAINAGVPLGALADAFEVARGKAVESGTDIETAFGKVVSSLDATKKPAADVAAELSRAAESAGTFSEAASRVADAADRASAAFGNLWSGILGFGRDAVFVAAQAVLGLVRALSFATAGLIEIARILAELGTQLPFVGSQFTGLAEVLVRGRDHVREVGAAAADLADAFFTAVRGSDDAAKAIARVDDSARQAMFTVVSLNRAQREAKVAADEHTTATDRTTAALAREELQLVRTTAAFDALRRAQGSAAATEAALAGGGTVSVTGSRVRLPNGGSRLIRPAPGSIRAGF